ncbi:MAG: prolyl oligopeptidase family serine peptidase, partial [Emcibacteraceae bacterium]|nr:prolyl oligopeptidase family serine peptidase [Emcibacteraceae bacterium]
RNYFGYKTYENYVKSDDWTIEEGSPIENREALKLPIFLAHGDIDRRVNVNQSQRFYTAMKKDNKDIIYHEYEGGDHFFSEEKHRIEFLTEVEKFLKNNL